MMVHILLHPCTSIYVCYNCPVTTCSKHTLALILSMTIQAFWLPDGINALGATVAVRDNTNKLRLCILRGGGTVHIITTCQINLSKIIACNVLESHAPQPPPPPPPTHTHTCCILFDAHHLESREDG